MKRDASPAIHNFFASSFSLLLVVSAGNCLWTLLDESEMIRNQMGTHSRSKIVGCKGHPLRLPHNDKG
jgi:hypothetical protein